MIERLAVKTLAELRAAYDVTYRRAEYGDKECLYDLALKRGRFEAGERVVDVACGAGQWLAYLSARGFSVAGCDLSEEALERARRRLPDAPLWLCDGAALPLASASVAALTCLGSLEHFLDPARGAAELRRVLRPSGRALILLPNSYYSGDIWGVIRSGYGPNHHQAIDRFATCNEWRDLLEGAGLVVERVDRYDKGKLWKRLFPFQLAYHFLYRCRRAP